MNRWLLFILSLFFMLPLSAQEEEWEYPLGPVGATFRTHSAAPYARVIAVEEGSPGALAGLQVDDFLYGYKGKSFGFTDREERATFRGVVQDLGEAIEHAYRFENGFLELDVLRPNVGKLTLNVAMPTADGLGAAFPLGSTSTVQQYEAACESLYQLYKEGGGNYASAFGGLVLLSHANANETTGDKPYRVAVNHIRDYYLAQIASMPYAPVEAFLYDGSANPNYVSTGNELENWYLGPGLLFLTEYAVKTGDTSFTPSLQTISEMVANRIQWWRQPQSKLLAPGMTAHGGVHGDYGGRGMNITGSEMFAALAAAKKSGLVDMTARPRDGRYFGYAEGATLPAGMTPYDEEGIELSVVPDGWENVNPSLEDKLQFKWQHFVETTSNKGRVSYAYGYGNGDAADGGGRTAGALTGYFTGLQSGSPSVEDQQTAAQMADAVARFHPVNLNNHAHCLTGFVYGQLTMPNLTSKQRRFVFENWKFWYHLGRKSDGSRAYMYSRRFADSENQQATLAEVYNALPYAVAKGGLSFVPAYDSSEWIVDFKETPLRWETMEYRELQVDASSYAFDLSVLDSAGNAVDAAAYSVRWQVVDGPAGDTIFSNTLELDAALTFTEGGIYQVRLTISAVDGSQTLTEDLHLYVSPQTVPAGWRRGEVEQQFFVRSSSIAALKADKERYPNEPTGVHVLNVLEHEDLFMGNASVVNGFLTAPTTGDYTFYVAGNTEVEFWFDQNDANGLQRLCYSSAATEKREWLKTPEQTSVTLSLTAGEWYPFQIFHVGAYGNRYFAAGWKKPNDSEIEVIGAEVLATPASAAGAEVVAQPESVTTTMGADFNLHFAVLDSGPGLYQWRRNGVNVGVPSHFPYFSMYDVGGGHEGDYDCVYTGPNGVITSDKVTIDLTDTGEIKKGGLWTAVYYNIRWRALSDLLAAPDYPFFAGASFKTDGAKTEYSWNDIGQRATGWIVPQETARYRFHFASNDDGRVYLGKNEYHISKEIICDISESGSGGPALMEWSAGVKSEWILLEAGKRYYLEVLHKAARTDSAHFALAMQKEGDPDPVDFEGELTGDVLEYRVGGYYSDTMVEPEAHYDDRIKVQPNVTHVLDLLANDDLIQSYSLESVGNSSYGTLTLLEDKRTVEFVWNGNDFSEESIAVQLKGEDGTLATSELVISGVDREDFGAVVEGGLWQELYTGIEGRFVSDLLDSPSYLPIGHLSQSIEAPDFVYGGENYGQIVTGWVVPEESGTYEFLVTADDRVELYLSYNASVAHRRLIAETTAFLPAYRRWSEADRSVAVELLAGQEYYIEIRHKQNTQDDYFALNWRKVGEGMPVDGSAMTGATFKYKVGGVDEFTLFTPPHAAEDFLSIQPLQTAQVDVLANDGSDQVLTLLSVGEALYGNVSIAADGRSVIYQSTSEVPQGESIPYTVTTAFGMQATGSLTIQPYGASNPYSVHTGGLWREVFENVSGDEVADLTSSNNFPLQPDTYGMVALPELEGGDDSYGQRLSGWILPSVSGDYIFLLSANDEAELWLSQSDSEALKTRIISHKSTGETPKQWSTATASAVVSLEAGKHYFLEMLHKEDTGTDLLALNWHKQGENLPADGTSITGATFSYSIGQNLGTPAEAGVLFPRNDAVELWNNGEVTVDLALNDFSSGNIVELSLLSAPTAARAMLNGTQLTLMQEGAMPASETISYTVKDSNGLEKSAEVLIRYYDFTTDLEAFYQMDHIVDGVVLDHSGKGRHATVLGDVSLSIDAKRDRALDVNRGSAALGYLQADMASNPIVLDQQLSLAFWAKGDASFYPTNYTAVDAVSNTGERVFAAQAPWKNGKIYWDAGNMSGWDRMQPEDTELLTLSTWRHWVFVKDAVTEQMRIYVDGELWQTQSGHARAFSGNIPLLRIGVNRNVGHAYHGLLDDVRVYSRVLSEREITLLYQHGHEDVIGDSLENLSAVRDGSGDLNSDGRIDLLDVAFGSDPVAPDLSKHPQMTMHNGLPAFKYNRISGGAALGSHVYEWNGLLYCIESSNSLESDSWSCDSALYEQVGFETDPDSGSEAIFLRPSESSDSEKLFFRLKLIQP